MRNALLAVSALALAAAAVPAAATTYFFNYTSTSAGAPLSASGRFTLSGNHVVKFSGSVDGDAITTLQSTAGLTPYSATQFLSPDGQFYFNNVFYAADPVFDAGGILFYSAGGSEYNIFGNGPGSYSLLKGTPFGGNGPQSTGTLTLTAAVPEASTWIMLVAGFGLVGVSARRRKAAVAA